MQTNQLVSRTLVEVKDNSNLEGVGCSKLVMLSPIVCLYTVQPRQNFCMLLYL